MKGQNKKRPASGITNPDRAFEREQSLNFEPSSSTLAGGGDKVKALTQPNRLSVAWRKGQLTPAFKCLMALLFSSGDSKGGKDGNRSR